MFESSDINRHSLMVREAVDIRVLNIHIKRWNRVVAQKHVTSSKVVFYSLILRDYSYRMFYQHWIGDYSTLEPFI